MLPRANESNIWTFFGNLQYLEVFNIQLGFFVLLLKTKDYKTEALFFITQSGKWSCNSFSTLRNLGKI